MISEPAGPLFGPGEQHEIEERLTKLEREFDILCNLLDVDVSYQYKSLYGEEENVSKDRE